MFTLVKTGCLGEINVGAPQPPNWQPSTIGNVVWNTVAYGNGLFIAFTGGTSGTSNRTATSTDGITWNTINSGFNYCLLSTFANGTFVVVTSDEVYSSSDGFSWSSSGGISNTTPVSITYGNGKFIILGTNGGTYYSTNNAQSFTQGNIGISNNWSGIAYGNGVFVAIGYNTGICAYSFDGINWTQNSITLSWWNVITYGNGKFVTISNNNRSNAAYSFDGITWYYTNVVRSANWNSITYGNGKFVAVANNASNSSYSTSSYDGITWFLNDMGGSGNYSWEAIAYGNRKFVAVGNVAVSTTGYATYSLT